MEKVITILSQAQRKRLEARKRTLDAQQAEEIVGYRLTERSLKMPHEQTYLNVTRSLRLAVEEAVSKVEKAQEVLDTATVAYAEEAAEPRTEMDAALQTIGEKTSEAIARCKERFAGLLDAFLVALQKEEAT